MDTFFLQLFGPALGLLILACSVIGTWVGICLRRSRLRWSAWLLFAAVLSFPLGPLLILKSNPFNARSFDRQVWAANDFKSSCGRGQMAGDLLRFHLPPGTHREQVISLLGQPDQKGRTDKQNEVYTYELGACSGIRIDLDYLNVVFDASGRVEEAYWWQS
jgi:hypothetical protein